MNRLCYRGQTAKVEFDDQDHIFVGHLTGIPHIISFHADSLDDLKAVFQETVDDYLEVAAKAAG